ncbi:MAG: TfoX/Sxy family protein [Gemmatimonadota bacterium]
MAFDPYLADRIRQRLGKRPGLTEKEMFGGLGFMLHGNMCCGIIGDEMIARLGPEGGEAALRDPHTRPFDFTGRPMRGWIFVEAAGLDDDAALDRWVARSVEFASSLPRK